jgi:site-specific recombinase XerC
MKKVSTVVVKQNRNISQQRLTIGLDLGDRNSWYCVLDESGQIQTPNMHRAKTNRSSRVRMEAWRQWLTWPVNKKHCSMKPVKKPLDSDRPSHDKPSARED